VRDGIEGEEKEEEEEKGTRYQGVPYAVALALTARQQVWA
jgi:hypothetical protein